MAVQQLFFWRYDLPTVFPQHVLTFFDNITDFRKSKQIALDNCTHCEEAETFSEEYYQVSYQADKVGRLRVPVDSTFTP